MKLLICGGAGFIGSNFVRVRARSTANGAWSCSTPSPTPATMESLADVAAASSFRLSRRHLRRPGGRERAGPGHRTDADRPLRRREPRRPLDPRPARSCRPTWSAPPRLLESARAAGVRALRARLHRRGLRRPRPHESALHRDHRRWRPRSPYSASKAAPTIWSAAYFHTFDLPALITRCSNNYGPYQFPEKLIPLMILNALTADAAAGLRRRPATCATGSTWRITATRSTGCSRAGATGEVYNIGGGAELANLDIVQADPRSSPDATSR